ncbi:hypothetical protein BSKO_07228 [Bryopsis sp. KO-2023]|nr:hypothetical protein BSKO_07228 [Bryopsis sp. KO-2023]
MKQNYSTTVDGKRVKLVPYRPEHVPKYHEWMQDPFLLETTASEPLTLEEEYAMQASWRDDPMKCTFIIIDKSRCEPTSSADCVGKMAGDVNLFFDEDDRSKAEVEVMVAEACSRRGGIAFEALTLFMAYAVTRLGVKTFHAKIGYDNAPSLNLFKKLGFVEAGKVEVFREFLLERKVEGEFEKRMTVAGAALVFGEYDAGAA